MGVYLLVVGSVIAGFGYTIAVVLMALLRIVGG